MEKSLRRERGMVSEGRNPFKPPPARWPAVHLVLSILVGLPWGLLWAPLLVWAEGSTFSDACMVRGDTSRRGNCTRAQLPCSTHPACCSEPAPSGHRPGWPLGAVDRSRLSWKPEELSQPRCFVLLGFRLRTLETSHFTNDLIVIMTILTLRFELL